VTVDPHVRSLLDQIRQSLSGISLDNIGVSSDSWDVFEAYVFSLILTAAREQGANISYENVSGNVPDRFFFRTSPGRIHSSRHPYTHAVIQFPNKPVLEAHIGVQVSGTSKILHECDVLVLHREEADACRAGLVSPRARKVILAVECKYYSSPIPLHLGRAFMGLVQDFSSSTKYFFVANLDYPRTSQLLAHHKRPWDKNIVPSSPGDVDRLRNAFQDVFKNFKAKA
jgi:hypothetical protein